MVDFESLGGSENTISRWAFLFLDFLVYFILFYASIGATVEQRTLLYFYILFGAILGTIPYIIDLLTKSGASETIIDTVALEDEQIAKPLESAKVQIILGILAAAVIGYQIFTTNSMWVAYPQFNMFSTPLGNAFIAALSAGYVESIVFFRFLMPSLHRIFTKYSGVAIGILMSVLITTASFLGYHLWRYSYSESAMMAVATFGFFNCILILLLRSSITNITTHFANNFVAYLLNVVKYALAIII